MDEIEIRAVIGEPGPIQKILSDKNFIPELSFDQLDIILDLPDASLFRSGQKIRLRMEKGSAELTYKGFFQGDTTASRRLEVNIPLAIENVENAIKLFAALGYPECFRIPKSRTVYRGDNIKVVFDEWPIIGCLLEIEGEEEACKVLAKEIAPGIKFGNPRLKELFRKIEKQTGKNLSTLKKEYEQKKGVNLGNIELLLD